MISKKDILKMVHSVTHYKGSRSKRTLVDPHREWFIGVSLFIIIAIGGGILNAQNYVYYDTIESTVIDTTVPIKKYDKNIAAEATDIYMKKQSMFNKLVEEKMPAVIVVPVTASTSDEVVTSFDDSELNSEAFEGGE